jgi:rhomboid protease GluP
MNRDKQLEYCKKCKKQAFDMSQGIVCGLTNQKADFTGECEHFELDGTRLRETFETTQTKKKKGYSLAFSPRATDQVAVPHLTRKQAYILAIEAVKKIGWNTGNLTDSGFTAYTSISLISWGEEIQIKIEVGSISIKSECTGHQFIDWGKNSRNLRSFLSEFNRLLANVDQMDANAAYEELSATFIPEGDSASSPLHKKEKTTGFFSVLLPEEGYTITPLLIVSNLLIFILMVATGVHLLAPSAESLLVWGANFRPLTIDGGWWRLISSLFLHVGIFHLVMNMYALAYIGLLLEPYLGKARFFSAYLLSGIAASLTSLSWNELIVSAGASGAIFGMYGVFLSMLTTRMIEKSARKSLLISIGIFVLYNLLNGMKEGIDNAAHIGGLISGLVIGYSYYPGMRKPGTWLKPVSIGAMTLLVTLSSFAVLKNTKSDFANYDKDMQAFIALEQRALRVLEAPWLFSEQQILKEFQNTGIPNWEACLELLEKADEYKLPPALKHRNSLMKEYCQLRIESYKIIIKALNEQTAKYDEEINDYHYRIDKLIQEITLQ